MDGSPLIELLPAPPPPPPPPSRNVVEASMPGAPPDPPNPHSIERERPVGRAPRPSWFCLALRGGGRGGGKIWVGVARRSAVTPPPVRAHRVRGAQRRLAAATPQGGTYSMYHLTSPHQWAPTASGRRGRQRGASVATHTIMRETDCFGGGRLLAGGPTKCAPQSHRRGRAGRGGCRARRWRESGGGELRREGGGCTTWSSPPEGGGGGRDLPRLVCGPLAV